MDGFLGFVVLGSSWLWTGAVHAASALPDSEALLAFLISNTP